MSLTDIKDVAKYLHDLGNNNELLDRYHKSDTDRSIWFEMVFAYWLNEAGIAPEYERRVNKNSEKSVDFVATYEGTEYQMELVRVEHSEEIATDIATQLAVNEPAPIHGVILSSGNKNPYFDTAAQNIRLQEKILEKVAKFGEPSINSLALVVVDCSNIHLGMLDDEDVRIAAYGVAGQEEYQKYWKQVRLKGLFEANYAARNADLLRHKVSAVIFMSALKPDALCHSFIASNPRIDVAPLVKKLPIFSRLIDVKPAF